MGRPRWHERVLCRFGLRAQFAYSSDCVVISRFYELHKNRHEQLQGNNEGLHSRLQAFLSFGCHKASQIIKVRFHKRVCEGRKHVDLTHGPLHMNVP